MTTVRDRVIGVLASFSEGTPLPDHEPLRRLVEDSIDLYDLAFRLEREFKVPTGGLGINGDTTVAGLIDKLERLDAAT